MSKQEEITPILTVTVRQPYFSAPPNSELICNSFVETVPRIAAEHNQQSKRFKIILLGHVSSWRLLIQSAKEQARYNFRRVIAVTMKLDYP